MSSRGDFLQQENSGKSSMAFYEPPHRKTSAEIINEARLAIRESQMADNSFVAPSIKPLQTQRPFTPRNKERLLFGKKVTTNRPPSSFSLRYLQTETETPLDPSIVLSPGTGTLNNNNSFPGKNRSNSLSEINSDKIFNIGVKEVSVGKIKLPSLERPLQKRKVFKNTSLDNLPEEYEAVDPGRNAFSSPQERTDYTDREDSYFGRPSSKQQSLSQCLLLGPQNLGKIFATENLSGRNNAAAGGRTVADVLYDLNYQSIKLCSEQSISDLLAELYECMDNEGLIHTKISSKLKIQILKSLYRYVEAQNEVLLLNIARVILALNVSGKNLSGVCKLIFKVAKNDKNDNLFFEKNILELFLDALGRSSPLDDTEACIYGYGSVKFLTMNSTLLSKILSLGILQLMILHIKIINNAKLESSTVPSQTNHALFQLTGALRNIVAEEKNYESFLANGTVPQLCQAMELFIADSEVVNNISRIFSTISSDDCCCDCLAEYKSIYRLFLDVFEKYAANEEIIVRVAYTLGNIVAKIDNTRVRLFQEKNSVKTLVELWKVYLERTLKICSLRTDNEPVENGNSEDVMIKVIRIIANVVINPEIGQAMNDQFGSLLIEEFLKVLISNPFKKNEELVMSILSTLNNLSYYYTSNTETDIFHVKQVEILEGITEYSKSKNKECVIESMRIMGNLSRSKITRNYITETELFPVLIRILDKVDLTLLKTAIGVFVNLMADHKSRILFKTSGGVSKLITILTDYAPNDWLLGMLVCQVLWNYCIDTVDLYELIPDKEIQQLLVILADYLDEEKLFGITETNEDSEIYVTQEYLIWEEFANVATNLLEKIECFLDTFDHIQIDCEDTTKCEMQKKDSSTNISMSAW